MTTAWTPDKMITPARVTHVARKLFGNEFHEGDCKSEVGREGEPCSICAAQNATWKARLTAVRRAMFEAFGHNPDLYSNVITGPARV
jgi:hypothetical protein